MSATHSEPGIHPRHRLDPLIHSQIRMSVVACLAAAETAEFAFVRDTVEVSDSVLSRQISILEEARYVKVRKGYVGKRPRTWLSLTHVGRRAFELYLSALTEITRTPSAGEFSAGTVAERTTRTRAGHPAPHRQLKPGTGG
jgi:DNA-binding MarR family transcriptional regulator